MADSGVSVRFYLQDGCARPIPFLPAGNFTARAGPNHRLITDNARQEGTVSKVSPHVVDSSAKYLTLLVDASMSIDPTERAQVLNAFIDSYGSGSGDTFMKLVAFSGRPGQLLVLTESCDEGFCNDVATLHSVVDTIQTSLDAWEWYDPHATAVYSAIQVMAAAVNVISQAHANAALSAPGAVPFL